jgi:hypothetical protein
LSRPEANAYGLPYVRCPKCDTEYSVPFDRDAGQWAEKMKCTDNSCDVGEFVVSFSEYP